MVTKIYQEYLKLNYKNIQIENNIKETNSNIQQLISTNNNKYGINNSMMMNHQITVNPMSMDFRTMNPMYLNPISNNPLSKSQKEINEQQKLNSIEVIFILSGEEQNFIRIQCSRSNGIV